MIGEEVIGRIISGFIQTHAVNKWAGLIVSMSTSGLCTFLSIGGAGIVSHLAGGAGASTALAYGIGEGSIAAAAIIFNLWRRSPLTKGLLISVPRAVETDENKILRDNGILTMPGGQK